MFQYGIVAFVSKGSSHRDLPGKGGMNHGAIPFLHTGKQTGDDLFYSQFLRWGLGVQVRHDGEACQQEDIFFLHGIFSLREDE